MFLNSKITFPQKKRKKGKKEKKPMKLTAVDKMQDCHGTCNTENKPVKSVIRGIHLDLAFFPGWILWGGRRSWVSFWFFYLLII